MVQHEMTTLSPTSSSSSKRNSFDRRHRSSRSGGGQDSHRDPTNRKRIYLSFLFIILIILVTFASVTYYFLIADDRSAKSETEEFRKIKIKMPCEEFHDVETRSSGQLSKMEKELKSSNEYLSIYMLTWNVNMKEPETLLSELFLLNSQDILYDVYVIVLEELPMKIMWWTDIWGNELEHLFSRFGYVLRRKETSVLTEVLMFVRRQDVTKFSSVYTYPAKIVNGLSMKGAVGLRFIYDNIKIAFLGAHLTPHDENYEQRIKDVRFLLNDIYFNKTTETMFNQDLSFIFGDLNFRLNPLTMVLGDESDQFDYIVQFVDQHRHDRHNPKRYEQLLNFDQIRYAQKIGDGFQEYEESSITFAPTFKFVIGTCDYDEKRRPAWTDRILWRNLLKLQQQQQNKAKRSEMDPNSTSKTSPLEPIMMYYNSLPQYITSDHKPVRQVAWIPVARMKQWKYQLRHERRRRRSRKSLDSIGIRGKGFNKISPDSGSNRRSGTNHEDNDNGSGYPNFTSRSMSVSHPQQPIGAETVSATPDTPYWWQNIDDPDLYQPHYRIEFYHIPNWNETRRFYAHFRILKEIVEEIEEPPVPPTGRSDQEETDSGTAGETEDKIIKTIIKWKPVSIHQPEVKRHFSAWDWVGLFPENFTALNKYLTYSYPKFGTVMPTEEAADALALLNLNTEDQPTTSSSSIQGDEYVDRTSRESSSTSSTTTTSTSSSDAGQSYSTTSNTDDVLTVYFDENNPLLAGRYVLVYVRNNGDVIGISEPFQIDQDIDLSSL